jgi:hypothetical protein
VESLDQLASALEEREGSMNESALRLRLSQQYVAALSKIYGEATIIGMPSGQGSGINQIVTALGLYKTIVGNAPAAPNDQV